MPLLEHRAAVQIIGMATAPTAIDRQLASFRLPKGAGFFNRSPTLTTFQAVRMEMGEEPRFTLFLIEWGYYWKFHVR